MLSYEGSYLIVNKPLTILIGTSQRLKFYFTTNMPAFLVNWFLISSLMVPQACLSCLQQFSTLSEPSPYWPTTSLPIIFSSKRVTKVVEEKPNCTLTLITNMNNSGNGDLLGQQQRAAHIQGEQATLVGSD